MNKHPKSIQKLAGFIMVAGLILLLGSTVNAGIGEIYYVGFDHLGTAKILVDESGNEVWPVSQANPPEVNELLPFGSEITVTPDETTYDLNFTGKELDRALELHYFGARYYNSELCRFLSPDPVGGTPEAPLSWNKYIYCQNNPINLYDPDGEEPVSLTIAYVVTKISIGAGLGALTGATAGAFDTKTGDLESSNALIGGVSGFVGGGISGGLSVFPVLGDIGGGMIGSGVSNILYNSIKGENPISDENQIELGAALVIGAVGGVLDCPHEIPLFSPATAGLGGAGANLILNTIDLLVEIFSARSVRIDEMNNYVTQPDGTIMEEQNDE